MTAVLDTYESQGLSEKQITDLIRLKNYLARNWKYIPTQKERGFKSSQKLGTIESSHRAYTYRMKKQGRSWTIKGARAMLGLLEARVNNSLESSLEIILK